MAKILVVDDRSFNRMLVAILLRNREHEISEAADGAAALADVRATRPDLIILDLSMPGMDGAVFMRTLRGDPAIAAIPVLFYTAHADAPSTQELATTYGVSTVLPKPATLEAIVTGVNKALGLPETTAP